MSLLCHQGRLMDGVRGDPYWEQVLALWQLDDNDAIRDLKQALDLLVSGPVSITEDYGTPWGPGKAIFTGLGGYCYRTDTLYQISDEDFTMEAWFYLTDPPTSPTGFFGFGGNQNFHQRHGLRNFDGFLQYFNSTRQPNFTILGDQPLQSARWCHAAIARDGGVLRLFLDGSFQGEQSISGSIISAGTWWGILAGYARISGDNIGPVAIHSCRLTAGVARYTSSFTPPGSPFARHGV